MEEDRSNEYEEMMKSDEDFEEDVVEEEEPLERKIDEDLKKIGTIKSEEEIKEENIEIKEQEDIEEVSPVEEEPEEVNIEEEPLINDPVIEEEFDTNEEPNTKLEIKEEKPKKELKEKHVTVPVKKVKKTRVVAKVSRVRKSPIKNRVVAKVTAKINPTKKRRNSLFPFAYSVMGIAIIILAIFLLAKTTPTVTAAAIVNGEEISINNLDKEYEFFFLIGGLPEEYKQQITKEFFLNSTLIPEKLVLAEAEKKNIQVTKEEVDAFVKNSVEQAGSTMEGFESTISSLGLTLEDIKEYFKKQLISFKVLNVTILAYIEVSDAEIEAAYNENKDLFESQNQTFEEIKGDLKNVLLIQKQRNAAQIYMNQLVQNADIEVYYPDIDPVNTIVVEEFSSLEENTEEMEEEPQYEYIEEVSLPESTMEISTFSDTGDSLCEKDGKPILRMYSTSWCPHCKWIKNTFNNVAQEYIDLGKVTAYHWELDTGDNELTDEIETSVPRSDIELFQKYNPEGYVPVFILGCKYFRVGNGYEAENDLAAEEAEFKAVITSLI